MQLKLHWSTNFNFFFVLKKGKGHVWGLWHCSLQADCTLAPCEFPSFISRGATHHIGTRDLCQRRRDLYKEFCQHIVIHGGSRFFYMLQSWDIGQILSLPSEGRHAEDFSDARKIQRLRPGLNPRTRVPEASMLTTRPPKPSMCILTSHVNSHDILPLYVHTTLWPLSLFNCLFSLSRPRTESTVFLNLHHHGNLVGMSVWV